MLMSIHSFGASGWAGASKIVRGLRQALTERERYAVGDSRPAEARSRRCDRAAARRRPRQRAARTYRWSGRAPCARPRSRSSFAD
jgi:hypothetical protein